MEQLVVDNDLFKWLVSLGVGGVLAGAMFMFYRKDMKQFTEQWKMQTELLLAVVRENTASNVRMEELLKALHRRLDNDARERSPQAIHGR